MSLSFTGPTGFRFFCLMVMITVLLLCLCKSFVDQFKDVAPIVQFVGINLCGFLLFSFSLFYGKKITNARHEWFNNAFLTAGVALILYSSSVEVDEEIHSVYLPVFYLVELFIVLLFGNKVKVETSEEKYIEMTRGNFNL